MSEIKVSFVSKKKVVEEFLEELKTILNDEAFVVENDLRIIRSRKQGKKIYFSTPYTLLDLDYDVIDVAERLKELTVEEYSETLLDKNDLIPPLLFVFGKDINERLVYIKVKIKGDVKRRVLCVSFHYAEWDMVFPYAS